MLKKLQEEVKPWGEHNFGDVPSWIPLLGVMEELGELAHAHLKEAQGIRNHENHLENAKDAIADLVIFLVHYCIKRNLDLEKIVQETWDKVKLRDWKKNPETAHLEVNNGS